MIRCNGGRSGRVVGVGLVDGGPLASLYCDGMKGTKFLFNFMSSESKVKSYFAADNVDDRLSDF